MTLSRARPSSFWRVYFCVQYRLLRLLDPLAAAWWRAFGIGNVVELRVVGRRSGQPRRVLLGLLRDADRWFLGHPNGDVGWTRNLESSESASLSLRWPTTLRIAARRLPPGELRDRAILSTSQHAFPGNVIYRLARPHIRAVGVFFEVVVEADDRAAM